MKRLRISFAIGILTTVLAASTAMAGQMPFGVTSPPPPPPTEDSVTGDMPGPGITSSSPSVSGDMPGGTSAVDPATEFTLNLLQSLFALF